MQPKGKVDVVLILSLLVIIGGIIFLIFVGSKISSLKVGKNNLKIDNSVKTIDVDKNYCDYAKKTLAWMDKKRNTGGKYFASVICDSELLFVM